MASPVRFLKRPFLLIWLFLTSSSLVTFAQTLTILYSFEDGKDGAFPTLTLVQGRDGNLYGTTSEVSIGNGTVFRITPQGSLGAYDFDGTHGSMPSAGLVLGSDGLLRGTTTAGGGHLNDGVVFSIGPQTPISVVLTFNGANGNFPEVPLVLGVDGNYYGTTSLGGANCAPVGCGTIFKLTPSGVETILHNFELTAFGIGPGPTSLVYGPDGAFYGATAQGGPSGVGTIFRITPSGNFTTLYNFDVNHGEFPSSLLLANDGNLYGTAEQGGDFNLGTVFRVSPTGVTVLHSFDGTDGEIPFAGLIQATDGNLYGTTSGGGTGQVGTIFSITPRGGTLTTLYNFDQTHGSLPEGLMQHTNGKLYGTTNEGGSPCNMGFGCGTVFSFDVGLGPFVTFVLPYGRVGSGVQILGQGLTGTTSVTFNGIPATQFNVVSDTFMGAIVPPGATTGPVQVTTPSGVLTSNVNLQIVP